MRYLPRCTLVHSSSANFERGLQTPVQPLVVVGAGDQQPGLEHRVGGLQRQGDLDGQQEGVHGGVVVVELRETVDDWPGPCPNEERQSSSLCPDPGTECTGTTASRRSMSCVKGAAQLCTHTVGYDYAGASCTIKCIITLQLCIGVTSRWNNALLHALFKNRYRVETHYFEESIKTAL